MKSISAIVACHNAAPHLGHCLSSLRGFDEVLFLDDASTDESAAIAAAFPHVEILTPSPSECQGSAVSKARLVAATAGDAVCIIDADDYLLDNPRLGQRLERFERPGVQVVTAPVEVLGHGRQYPYGDLWDFALGQGSQPGGLMWRGETLRELIGQAEFLPVASGSLMGGQRQPRRARRDRAYRRRTRRGLPGELEPQPARQKDPAHPRGDR
jgi:hypothetical protein